MTASPSSRAPRQGIRELLSPNAVNVGFAAILLLAGFLRLWQLQRSGLSGDEAVYAGQAALLAGDHGYHQYFILFSRGNSNFLLFQEIVSLFFRVFGVSDLIPRLAGAFFGIALVAVVYGIGRLVLGPRGGLVPMLLMALSSYAVGQARLALLDTCAAFFTALAILLFMLWVRDTGDPERRGRAGWYFTAFAAAAVLACEAKVTSALLLPIVVAYLALTRSYRQLSWRTVARGSVAGLVALVPVMIQLAVYTSGITAALSNTIGRTSPVPWTYYLNILSSDEGLPVVIGALVVLVCALARARREDLLLWLWLLFEADFLQLYPLKAHNYLLVAVVPLTVLCGVGIVRILAVARERVTPMRLAFAAALALGVILAGGGAAEAATHLSSQLGTMQNPGIRAVARWLDAHTGRKAGVMALSQGSAQYAVAFYADRNSYPFGRFRLATVLPGGTVVTPRRTPPGKFPLDWVTTFPNQYVQDGKVTYFIYGLPVQDDPSQLSYAGLHQTQRNYLDLIQSYGGKMVYRVSDGSHDEVMIFKVTRRVPKSHLSFRVHQRLIMLTGTGFTDNAPVVVYYQNHEIGTGQSNAQGVAIVMVPYPVKSRRSWHFVMKDSDGHYASVTGLTAAGVTDKLTASGLAIQGAGFAPGTTVSIRYLNATLGRARVSAHGTVRTTIHLPRRSARGARLILTDSAGRTASVLGPKPAGVSYTQHGSFVTVRGTRFNPRAVVDISYGGYPVGEATTSSSGTFTQVVYITTLMNGLGRLRAVDTYGRGASATGLQPVTIWLASTQQAAQAPAAKRTPETAPATAGTVMS